MGTVRFYSYANAGQVTDHANLAFYGNAAITIPSDDQPHSVGPTFHAVPAGRKIFGLTTHTHRLGIDSNVQLSSSANDSGMQLFDNPNWDNPPLKLFTPPLEMPSGQGLRYTCTYRHNTGATVSFRESA